MLISNLISILSAIKENEGDKVVEILCDPRQNSGIDKTKDMLKLVRISDDNNEVILSNEYRATSKYNGIEGEMWFNPELGIYEGLIKTNIEGFSGKFQSKEIYTLERSFRRCVDEYLDFMANAQLVKTKEIVNNIISSNQDTDLDYGEIQPVSGNDEDDDYGEI